MAERWDEHLRQREGETNAEYWQRQIEWNGQEAVKIEAWCAGARAMLAVEPPQAPTLWTRIREALNG